jgi:thioredoxin 1
MKRSKWVMAGVAVGVLAIAFASQNIGSRHGRQRQVPVQRSERRKSAGIAAPGAAKAPDKTRSAAERKRPGPLPGSELAKCLKSGRPTMADFGRGWCIPCKMMVPVLKRAAQDYRGRANIVFVELDEYADLGRKHRIAAMPTQIFFNAKGKEVSRNMGYLDSKGIDLQFAKMAVKK